MKNEILQTIIDTLQCKVDVALGAFANEFIERSDYEALGLIAKIGENTTSYFDGLATTIHYNDKSVATIDVQEVVDAEVVNETAKDTVETPESPVYIEPYTMFSIPVDETKEWILDYLGKRGGQSLIEDLCEAYYKEFSHRFMESEIITKRWRENIFKRVFEMRKVKKGVINLIVPTNGKRSQYYQLSKHGLQQYAQKVKRLEKTSGQLEMWATG